MRNTIDLLTFEIWLQDFSWEWVNFLHLKLSAFHQLAISGKLMVAMVIYIFIYFLNFRFNHISNWTGKFNLDISAILVLPTESSIKFTKSLASRPKKVFIGCLYLQKTFTCFWLMFHFGSMGVSTLQHLLQNIGKHRNNVEQGLGKGKKSKGKKSKPLSADSAKWSKTLIQFVGGGHRLWGWRLKVNKN